jgi:predicted Zn-dependent peptidase
MPQDTIYKSELANGVTVIVDPDQRFSSVAYAVCLYGGLRGEDLETVGLTHFCEHLLIKRTNSRDPQNVAAYIDRLGGEINAFTDADSLCLHGVVPAGNSQDIMDFFAELLLQPAFTKEDVETEREIIRQEILESEDDPSSVVYREFSNFFWPDSVLGAPTFGTLDSLASFSYGDVYERLHSLLQGRKIIIVASGAVDPEQVMKHAEKSFAHLEGGKRPEFETPISGSGICLIQKQFTQVHFALGAPWPSMKDEQFLTGVSVASALGEGMSSRLFQALREERGLVYDVGADIEMYADTSCLSITGAVELTNLSTALDLVVNELKRLREEKISTEELTRVISLHKSQLAMEGDSLSTRMWRCLESEMVFGRYISPSFLSEQFEKITTSDVEHLLERWFDQAQFLLVVAGEVDDFDFGESVFSLCGDRITRAG